MNGTHKIFRHAGAFTLLELLLAVAVFSVVILAIHFVFFGAIRLRNKTTAATDAAVPLQQAVTILRRDLMNVLVPGSTFSGQFQSAPATASNLTTSASSAAGGRRVSPDLYTASANLSDTLPWSEVQKVSYSLLPSTNGGAGLDLVRSITRNLLPALTEEPESQWLMAGVQDVVFQFYDGTQWRDAWDSTTETTPLPQAIKVQISLAPEDSGPARLAPVELLVPVTVQARTNQVASASGGGG